MRKIVLASKSPRRKEIMEMLPWAFEIDAVDTDEHMNGNQSLEENLHQLAYNKAKPIAEKYPEALVIGSDTIVYADDEILGKPKDAADAKRMLKIISTHAHYVYTGVCILNLEENICVQFSECTKVHMTPMNDAEIDYYVEEGEPFGKAGAYAIQGKGGVYVEKIEGDFYNVMGLPLNRLYKELRKLDEEN